MTTCLILWISGGVDGAGGAGNTTLDECEPPEHAAATVTSITATPIAIVRAQVTLRTTSPCPARFLHELETRS